MNFTGGGGGGIECSGLIRDLGLTVLGFNSQGLREFGLQGLRDLGFRDEGTQGL